MLTRTGTQLHQRACLKGSTLPPASGIVRSMPADKHFQTITRALSDVSTHTETGFAAISRRKAAALAVLASIGAFAGPVAPVQAAIKELPKAYQETVKQIIKSLRETFSAEAMGAPETEVRRKADPAKEAVKEFVAKWRGDPRVSKHPSHDEIVGAITLISGFYQKNGPRASMPSSVAQPILAHLDAAEASLQASVLADPAAAAAEAAAKAAAAVVQRRGLPSKGAQDEDSALMELIPGA